MRILFINVSCKSICKYVFISPGMKFLGHRARYMISYIRNFQDLPKCWCHSILSPAVFCQPIPSLTFDNVRSCECDNANFTTNLATGSLCLSGEGLAPYYSSPPCFSPSLPGLEFPMCPSYIDGNNSPVCDQATHFPLLLYSGFLF